MAKPTPRQQVARAQSEKALQQRVLDLLHALGYRTYHARYSLGADAGWPDILAVRGRSMFALELKRESGVLSLAQIEWLEALGKVEYVTAKAIRPSDEGMLTLLLQGAKR